MIDYSFLDGASILVTGGTGSFGKRMIRTLLKETDVRRAVVYSRDELKQYEMAQAPKYADPRLRFFIGDVRDRERLSMALVGIDFVIHAAALKHVPACEYNPFEAVKTNVLGAQNVIECAIERGVRRVVALSTDKAANPVNLYGATKLCSDKLFISGNFYSGDRPSRFSVVRYGNVVGSRGSVVPLFLRKRKDGVLPITDERMTRFWITLDQGVHFVLDSLAIMGGGEIFVPKIPSMRITDVARCIGPECRLDVVGIRNGEKLHEVMVPEEDAREAVEMEDRFVINAQFDFGYSKDWGALGVRCSDGFRYGSDTNDRWLSGQELARMVAGLDLPEAREFARERGFEP
ncbi:MAG TPA: UDP-N-acetylglucosamine 4,6-dehydratase (inverting) [Rhodothermales bacterium]|nr:UDP-N-acetylglucosamine 4,6-dehydratase (inverting) [Rhodothermales bacterium]